MYRIWDKINKTYESPNAPFYLCEDGRILDSHFNTRDGEVKIEFSIGLKDGTKWDDLSQKEKQKFYNEVRTEDGMTIKYRNVEDVKHLWKGKLIYEGDIIYQRRISDCKYLEWETMGVVKFGIKDFSKIVHGCCVPCYYLEPAKIEQENRLNCRETNIKSGILNSKNISDKEMPLKVIGNIYENPELLEVQND